MTRGHSPPYRRLRSRVKKTPRRRKHSTRHFGPLVEIGPSAHQCSCSRGKTCEPEPPSRVSAQNGAGARPARLQALRIRSRAVPDHRTSRLTTSPWRTLVDRLGPLSPFARRETFSPAARVLLETAERAVAQLLHLVRLIIVVVATAIGYFAFHVVDDPRGFMARLEEMNKRCGSRLVVSDDTLRRRRPARDQGSSDRRRSTCAGVEAAFASTTYPACRKQTRSGVDGLRRSASQVFLNDAVEPAKRWARGVFCSYRPRANRPDRRRISWNFKSAVVASSACDLPPVPRDRFAFIPFSGRGNRRSYANVRARKLA